MKIPKSIVLLLRIVVTGVLLLLYFKVSKIDFSTLWDNIKGADKPLLLLAFFVFFLGYVLALLRWEMLLKAVKINLPFKRIIISFSGGIFFSLLLPSTIGGDLMRSVDLASHTKRPKEVIATIFLDRLSGYAGLVILALSSLALGYNLIRDTSVVVSIMAISAVLFGILLVLFNKFVYTKINNLLHSPNGGKTRELIKNLHQEVHYFRHHKRVMLTNLIFSILIQGIAPLTLFIIAVSLGVRVNIIYFFIFTPIVSAITLLPISIGGLGVREGTTTLFFIKAGMMKDLAGAMALINSSFVFACGAIGGLVYVLTVHNRRIQHHQPSALHPHA